MSSSIRARVTKVPRLKLIVRTLPLSARHAAIDSSSIFIRGVKCFFFSFWSILFLGYFGIKGFFVFSVLSLNDWCIKSFIMKTLNHGFQKFLTF